MFIRDDGSADFHDNGRERGNFARFHRRDLRLNKDSSAREDIIFSRLRRDKIYFILAMNMSRRYSYKVSRFFFFFFFFIGAYKIPLILSRENNFYRGKVARFFSLFLRALITVI